MVIDETGTKLGVVKTAEALNQARAKGLDLVEVGPLARPPVARIMDFKKFKYQQQKTAVKPKRSKVKMLRIGVGTSEHDLAVRTRQIEKFFGEGHKVQVQMTMRGREKAHPGLAREKLTAFLQKIPVGYVVEQEPRNHPYCIIILLRKK